MTLRSINTIAASSSGGNGTSLLAPCPFQEPNERFSHALLRPRALHTSRSTMRQSLSLHRLELSLESLHLAQGELTALWEVELERSEEGISSWNTEDERAR